MAPESGWWRFTFTAQVVLYNGYLGPVGGNLNIDGEIVASLFNDPEAEITFDMTMNTIQHVTAGRSITLEWYGDGKLFGSTQNKYSHFTGEYLGNTGPTPPECEYPDQTQLSSEAILVSVRILYIRLIVFKRAFKPTVSHAI